MKNDNRQRLFELMRKIDPSFNIKKVLTEGFVGTLNEGERVMYNNLLQLFQENNLATAKYIAIGYVNAVAVTKRAYPTDSNEAYANKLIQTAEEIGLTDLEVSLLKEFISSDLWTKTKSGQILLKGKKDPKTHFDIDSKFSSIIQFNRYVLNYQDRAALAKNFQDQKDAEMNLRRKYGFGQPEDQYPDDDWRRKLNKLGKPKYRGTGIEPLIHPDDVNKGSTYKDKLGDFPLQGDVDKEGNPRIDPVTGYQRMSLRQNIATNMLRDTTQYFLVDEQGNLNKVSYRFVNFFTKYLKKPEGEGAEELQGDEKEFVAELETILSRYKPMTFLSDRLAYMTATVEDDKTKEKKPVYFYNDKLDILEAFPVNIQQLQNYINQYLKDSFITAKEIADKNSGV